jgi:hypothetical protein
MKRKVFRRRRGEELHISGEAVIRVSRRVKLTIFCAPATTVRSAARVPAPSPVRRTPLRNEAD